MAEDKSGGPGAPAGGTQQHLGKLMAFNASLAALALFQLLGPLRQVESVASAVLLILLATCLVQLMIGCVALFQRGTRLKGAFAMITAPAMVLAGLLGTLAGMGWGRPLRVHGKQVFPQLTQGADWTQGERPALDGLNAATRAALEALWLLAPM